MRIPPASLNPVPIPWLMRGFVVPLPSHWDGFRQLCDVPNWMFGVQNFSVTVPEIRFRVY